MRKRGSFTMRCQASSPTAARSMRCHSWLNNTPPRQNSTPSALHAKMAWRGSASGFSGCVALAWAAACCAANNAACAASRSAVKAAFASRSAVISACKAVFSACKAACASCSGVVALCSTLSSSFSGCVGVWGVFFAIAFSLWFRGAAAAASPLGFQAACAITPNARSHAALNAL